MTPVTTAARAAWSKVPVSQGLRETLLLCGIVSSVLYIVADMIAASRWHEYSYSAQSFSELLAIGAATRPFMFVVALVYNPLVIAFGLGVFATTQRRGTQTAGILLVAYGLVSFAGPFFPIHQRGAQSSLTDEMHIIITSLLVLLMLLFIGFGSVVAGRRFRIYSIATILFLLLFGALAGMQGVRMAANLPTPWLGIEERINIYASMIWTMVLAAVMLRANKSRPAPIP